MARVTAVLLCIVGMGIWWVMLFLAFAGSTTGSRPDLASRDRAVEPAYVQNANGGITALAGPGS